MFLSPLPSWTRASRAAHPGTLGAPAGPYVAYNIIMTYNLLLQSSEEVSGLLQNGATSPPDPIRPPRVVPDRTVRIWLRLLNYVTDLPISSFSGFEMFLLRVAAASLQASLPLTTRFVSISSASSSRGVQQVEAEEQVEEQLEEPALCPQTN